MCIRDRGLSETAKLTLKMAYDIAQDYAQDYCGTEHILYSILSQKNARATILLRDMNVNIDGLNSELEQFLNHQQYEEQMVGSDGKTRKKNVDVYKRQKYMQELSKSIPEYGFEKHVGYGTKLHIDKLKIHGISQYHRKSFKPVAAML